MVEIVKAVVVVVFESTMNNTADICRFQYISYTNWYLLCEIQFNKISFANNSGPIHLSVSSFSRVRKTTSPIRSRLRLFFTCDENENLSLSSEGKLAVVVWLDFGVPTDMNENRFVVIHGSTEDYIDGLDNNNTNTIQYELPDISCFNNYVN